MATTAHALTQADLAPLAGDDFDAKGEAIATIVKAPAAEARRLLEALADDSVLSAGQRGLVIKTDGGYVDAITGAKVEVDDAALEDLGFNNSLRAMIAGALSGLQLGSTDIAVRRAAIDTLLENPGNASLEVLDQAIARERDAVLKVKLQRVWAMQMLDGEGSVDDRVKALGFLAGDNGAQALQRFGAVLERGDDGRWKEPEARVRLAAERALAESRSRQTKIDLLGNLFAGLSLGSVLLLAALGLAITYGLIGVINMAHGEFLMIGAYATYAVQSLFRRSLPDAMDWYLVASLPVAFLAAALVGFVIERLVLRHLYGRPLETLLATFGLSLLLMQGVRMLFGAQNVEVANPSWMSGGWEPMPGLILPYNRIVILLFALAVVAIAWAVLNRTRLGLFVRAVTQNRSMAACVGVRTWKVDSYAFAFGAGIAGLGGCALSQIGNVGPDLGQGYIIDSFMAVVLGGVGQLTGTIVGAFGLGILNKFIEPSIGAVLAKILVLVLIVMFIQKRPQGLFALKGRSAEA
ncbi:MAG: urea ABC transporter permease subunit UrtB [Burkholderiaceae bacterium]